MQRTKPFAIPGASCRVVFGIPKGSKCNGFWAYCACTEVFPTGRRVIEWRWRNDHNSVGGGARSPVGTLFSAIAAFHD